MSARISHFIKHKPLHVVRVADDFNELVALNGNC